LEKVGRRAFPLQDLAHDADGLERRFLAARMGRENNGVPALEREHADAGRGQVGVGGGNERRDHADRLGVLDDPLFGDFLDDPDALLPQDIPQNPHDLETFRDPAFGVAQLALLNSHIGKPRKGLFIGDPPRHGLAQAVHPRLVVIVYLLHGRARPRQ
jgi:hypothetical protein